MIWERFICCLIYLCIHCFILAYAPTKDWTPNLGESRQSSNQWSYLDSTYSYNLSEFPHSDYNLITDFISKYSSNVHEYIRNFLLFAPLILLFSNSSILNFLLLFYLSKFLILIIPSQLKTTNSISLDYSLTCYFYGDGFKFLSRELIIILNIDNLFLHSSLHIVGT